MKQIIVITLILLLCSSYQPSSEEYQKGYEAGFKDCYILHKDDFERGVRKGAEIGIKVTSEAYDAELEKLKRRLK